MPRLPRLRTSALRELARQIQFSAPLAARRQLLRAEALAEQVLRDSIAGAAAPAYPEEWVVFRVTGLRPEASGKESEPASVVREALLGDLGGLTQRLSQRAQITARECPGPAWLSASDLQTRWSCSRKTIERWQRSGLISRRVRGEDAREHTVFSAEIVELVDRLRSLQREDGESGNLGDAGHREAAAARVGRMSPGERDLIVRQARKYHAKLGWSLDRCAARLAERLDRTRQAVRKVLEAHDASGVAPIFAASGAAPSKGKQHRDRRLARLARLKSLPLDAPTHDAVAQESGLRRALEPELARSMLTIPQPISLGAFLARASQARELGAAQERAIATAYCALMHDARVRLARVDVHHPSSGELDEIETALRHAGRLKARLVGDELALVVRTIETQIGAPAMSLGVRTLYSAARTGIVALVEAAGNFDPFKGGRLAAPGSLTVGRAVASALKDAALRAAAEVRPKAVSRAASVDVDSNVWDGVVSPWQAWLEPPPAVVQRVESLGSPKRELLTMRLGLDQGAPRTLRSIAAELSRPLVRVASEERAALKEIGWTP